MTTVRPWETLPHPTPAQRATRHAARQAAALVRRHRLASVTRIDLSVSGPPVDAAIRRWWSGWGRRALLPVGLLALGPNGRCWLFSAAVPDGALVAGLHRAVAAAVGAGAAAPRLVSLGTGATPIEVRRIMETAEEGHRRGAHRYLFAGR